MKKSYIWSLPTRVFHLLFALFILIAFLTDDDKLLKFHAIAGYSILILLVFRVYWDILVQNTLYLEIFQQIRVKLKSFLKISSDGSFKNEQKHIGHNPLASYVMIAMLIVTFIVIVTGVLAYGIQEGKGLASFLNDSFFKNMKLFKEIHEFFANFLIFLIVAHLTGVAFDRVFHKKHETLNSIATGYKMTSEDESIKLSFFQKLFAIVMFVAFIAFLIFNLYKPDNALVASKFEPIDYKTQNVAFVNECGSCHTLYPSKSIA